MPSKKTSAQSKAAQEPRVGRPSKYSAQLADAICERLIAGDSIRTICKSEDMPAASTVFKWLAENKAFSEQYARAREIQAEMIADELLDIADDGSNDYMTITKGDKEYEVVNGEAIQRSKLRVDARKWVASKLLPKKYGDKVQMTGDGGGPVVFTVGKIGAKQ